MTEDRGQGLLSGEIVRFMWVVQQQAGVCSFCFLLHKIQIWALEPTPRNYLGEGQEPVQFKAVVRATHSTTSAV